MDKEDDHVAAQTATHSKLEELMGSFAVFDDVMRIGTQQRREKDEHFLAEMRQEMSRLEHKLEAEIKKRIEMNKSLQTYCDDQIAQMTASFENLLNDRAKHVDDRLNILTQEIDSLQARVAKEKQEIPTIIESKTNELTQKLVGFMDLFEKERLRQINQEAIISKRLSDHEHVTAQSLERERHDRESKYSDLKIALDTFTSTRTRGSEKFHAFTQREIANIQNALVAEAQAREREDDEIVEALNRYTAKLQDSLKIITSPDT